MYCTYGDSSDRVESDEVGMFPSPPSTDSLAMTPRVESLAMVESPRIESLAMVESPRIESLAMMESPADESFAMLDPPRVRSLAIVESDALAGTFLKQN